MFNYVESLKAQHAAGQLTTEQFTSMTAAAMEQLPAIIAIEDAYLNQVQALNSVSEAANVLNLNFDQTSPLALQASEALVELMGGFDEFGAATNSYYNQFYTAKEREQIELANSAIAVENYNNTLALSGQAAITSKEQFREYVESLDLTTAAGQQAFASAMEVSEAMFAVTEAGGDVNQIMSEMPENLRGNFDEMTTITSQTADNVSGLYGGMLTAAANATSQMVGSTDVAIAGLQDLAASINQETQAGKNAYEAVTNQIVAITLNGANAMHGSATAASNNSIQLANSTASVINGINRNRADQDISASQRLATQTQITRTQLLAYANSLDRSTAAGRSAHSAVMAQVNSLNRLTPATQSASNSFNTLSSRIGSLSSQSINAANRIRSAGGTIQQAMREANYVQRQINLYTRVDGSHMLGLDYVPFDGYIAELHKGERVLTKEENTQLTDGLEFNPVNNISVSPSAIRPASNDNNYVAEKLSKIYQELAEIRNDNAKSASSNENLLSGISGETGRQTDALREGNRIQYRINKKERFN